MSRRRTCIAIAVMTIALALTLLPAHANLVPLTNWHGVDNTNTPTQNYAGAAKVVLQITSIHNGAYDQSNFESYFGVHVLYSNDSAIKVGSDYTLMISQMGNKAFFQTTLAPSQLTTGTIIGINDYTVDGGTIDVDFCSDDSNAWEQYITILSGGMGVTDSLQLNPESLLSLSNIPSTTSLGTGNSLFNMFSTSSIMDNSGQQTPSTSSESTVTAGLSQPFSRFSKALNAFPSLDTGKMFGTGGLI